VIYRKVTFETTREAYDFFDRLTCKKLRAEIESLEQQLDGAKNQLLGDDL
jgi:hypothetical protein